MTDRFFDDVADLGDDKRIEIKSKTSQSFQDLQNDDIEDVKISVENPDGDLIVDSDSMTQISQVDGQSVDGHWVYNFETERNPPNNPGDFPAGVYKFTAHGTEKQVDEYEVRKVRFRR